MPKSNLFLCFRGDGPYWRDLIYVTAYPSGYSYSKWAFRYAENRLVSSVVEAEVHELENKHVQTEAILGVRFHHSHTNLLLPLRRIEINWIELSGGITQFYFRVLALLDFKKFSSLHQACLKIPDSEMTIHGGNSTALALRSQVKVDALPWSTPKTEDSAWSNMLELISSNAISASPLPLSDASISATYFRFSDVFGGDSKTVPASRLELSQGQGAIYGAQLKEGHQYRVKLSHRILAPQHDGTAPILPLTFDLPTGHLQLAEPSKEVLGWYQTTPIVFRAVQAAQGHQILLVRSNIKDSESGAKRSSEASDIYLPIPFTVKVDWLFRLRRRWLPWLGLTLALTFQTSIAFFRDFIDKLLEGRASLYDLTHYWREFLLIFVGGAVASIFVSVLSDRTKSKG